MNTTMMQVTHPASDTIRLVDQEVRIVTTREEMECGLRRIEAMGRICWQSEPRDDSPVPFIKRLLQRQHESVLEHMSLSVIFITDRATSHQLVRHRHTAISQESQRYCCYAKDKFDGKLQIVPPQSYFDPATPYEWHRKFIAALEHQFDAYASSIDKGFKPEDARSLLPNATKTQLGITASIREWRAIFQHRCDRAAQPQVRALMLALRKGLGPCSFMFEDIPVSDYGIFRYPAIPEIPTMQVN